MSDRNIKMFTKKILEKKYNVKEIVAKHSWSRLLIIPLLMLSNVFVLLPPFGRNLL